MTNETNGDRKHSATNKRQLLAWIGTAGVTSLAGCNFSGVGGVSDNDDSGSSGEGSTPTLDVSAKSLGELPSGACEQASLSGQTTVSQRIESDTTVGQDVDVVYARNGLFVASGATLTVEPGTTVVFPQQTSLQVSGTLNASGTCSDPIAFVGEQDRPGYWRGITVNTNGAGTLDHVLVENGGEERAGGITVDSDGLVDVTNTEVRGSSGNAIVVGPSANSSLGGFSGNALAENEGHGVVGGIRATSVLDEATVYSPRGYIGVLVQPSTVPDGETVVLPDIGPSYSVAPDGGGGISVSGTLEIEPGATLRFGREGHITVERTGELVADARNTDRIRLIGLDESRGSWTGVRFRDAQSAGNVLRNVAITFAGKEDGQAVLLDGESRALIRNCQFQGSANYGLRLRQNATIEKFTRNAFAGNGVPIWTSARTANQIGSMNSFDKNDDNRVHVYAGEFDGHIIPEGEDHSWSDPGVPFLLKRARGGAFAVQGSLSLGKGITLEMAQGHGILVTGEMSTRVESDDIPSGWELTDPPEEYVTFEGAKEIPGYWNGIGFNNTLSTENVLKYVEILHAGGGRLPPATEQRAAAVQVLGDSALAMSGPVIRESDGFGVYAQRVSGLFMFAAAFVDNEAPMYLYPKHLSNFLQDNFTIEENDTNQIFVKSPIEAVTEPVKWVSMRVPYRILPSEVDENLDIDAKVEVGRGVEMRFEQNVGLIVRENGELSIDGGSGGEVTDPKTVLRGVQAIPGYWRGVRYSETAKDDNVITGTGIYHTGSASWPDLVETEPKRAAVAATGAAEATVQDCHIADFEGAAFAEAFTSNPLNEDGVNSTLNLSGNVIE